MNKDNKQEENNLTPKEARLLLGMVDAWKIEGTLREVQVLAPVLAGIRGKLQTMAQAESAPAVAAAPVVPTEPVIKAKRKRH